MTKNVTAPRLSEQQQSVLRILARKGGFAPLGRRRTVESLVGRGLVYRKEFGAYGATQAGLELGQLLVESLSPPEMYYRASAGSVDAVTLQQTQTGRWLRLYNDGTEGLQDWAELPRGYHRDRAEALKVAVSTVDGVCRRLAEELSANQRKLERLQTELRNVLESRRLRK